MCWGGETLMRTGQLYNKGGREWLQGEGEEYYRRRACAKALTQADVQVKVNE